MIAALLCVTLTIPFSSPAYNNIVWFPNCIHSSCWIRKFSGLLEFLYSRVWYLYLNSAVLNKKLISAGLRSFQLYFWWDCTTHRAAALREEWEGNSQMEGLLSYRKWVPQQLGDVIKQGSGDSRPMRALHGDTAANHNSTHFFCGRPDPYSFILVDRMGSYF